MRRRGFIWVVTIAAAVGAFGLWYVATYSMGVAEAEELIHPAATQEVLIVTQKSDYKDALTADIVGQLKSYPLNIRVIDLTTAAACQGEMEVDACLLIHTWEMWRPPGMVGDFQDCLPAGTPLFAVSTSGSGEEQLSATIDGISSASVIMDAEKDANKAIDWLKGTLKLTTKIKY